MPTTGDHHLRRPWKTYRVLSGHLGCVRSIAFNPANDWFSTGSDDRTIKIWDVGSGQLKLSLTGHVLAVHGLAVSSTHPYLFSAGADKQVKCWDLEYNKVIRSYHGHLSGVYCLALHPTLDNVFLTGGQDSVCRVWDVRTRVQVHALSGHKDLVSSVMAQAMHPQIIVTGSHDTTVKLWDLVAGKSMSTLTFHKKAVRALARHPLDHSSFASASIGNIKKFALPRGEFLTAMKAKSGNILHCAAVNEESVMVSGGDDGSLWFYDWRSGHSFQQQQTKGQPGSLEGEQAIYALSYDVTGTRLVTCEADKTVKMWKQDETTMPHTHPLNSR